MKQNNQKEKDLKIVRALIKHATGELCSRYILGLRRAEESIRKGSPKDALEEQEAWAENIKESKAKKKQNKKA